MHPHPGTRRSLPSTSFGLGQHFSSPTKRHNKRKTQTNVIIPGQSAKWQCLLQQLSDLLNHKSSPSPLSTINSPPPEPTIPDALDDTDTIQHSGDELSPKDVADYSMPSVAVDRLYDNWMAVIPTIIEPYLQYMAETVGKPLITYDKPLSGCQAGCELKHSSLLCLYFDRFATVTVLSCVCTSLPQLLLHSGLFPTAPSQPRLAVSVELLAFYRALFERSCDSINALASALNAHYERRGFWMTTREYGTQGGVIRDPFRRSIGNAVQWYNILQVHIERRAESIIKRCRQTVLDHLNHTQSAQQPSFTAIPPSSKQFSLSQCASILVQRCPACFAGRTFGWPLSGGGDIHIALDGNFHHRHWHSAGSCPAFYDPAYFIPKVQVDNVGCRIERVHKRPPRQWRVEVPDEAIDQCEASYEAADGNKQKATMDCFDDTGIMALICCHDIPLFFANIDTPGEQQKYSVALLEHLFSHLPATATVVALYDIGCVLARSLDKFEILDNEIADLEVADRALQAARAIIEKDATEDTLAALESLERSHDRLLNKVDLLYASLNIHDKFPELNGIDMEFIRMLLLACDLKINIRKQAIGSFFEWDKLDRTVGGKQKALGSIAEPSTRCRNADHFFLGTKLHQQTRKAIAKCQPALMSAIRKFNMYCERLAKLYDASSGIPLPSPLPTKLAELRNDQSLFEDVWITPSIGEIPQWLQDSDVREGIRAVLKTDCCLEEQHCLGMEADNMCRWFGSELCAVELAIRQPENSMYSLVLQQHRESLAKMQERWPMPLASTVHYASQARSAQAISTSLAGTPAPLELRWLPPIQCDVSADGLSEADSTLPLTDVDAGEHVLDPDQTAFTDILEDVPSNADEDGLSNDDEDQKTHNVNLVWEIPFIPVVDMINVHNDLPLVCGVYARRVRQSQDGFPRYIFELDDYERLASPTGLLNDSCINGCAALLYSEFLSLNAAWCAILSTHDLPCIQYHAEDNILWRNTSRTCYWEKPIWILPIHRPSPAGHWVVCIVKFTSKQILLFDSLAEQKPWKRDVKDIAHLVTRLSLIASKRLGIPRRDFGSWSAHPIALGPLQSNGYDCGLWVLAQVTAVLRGCNITNLRKADMRDFRRYLQCLILRIPV
ncbi:hypothetical protein M404DRAFT_30479 [Pisolithus tinctorius Marx 270]|uniref:Ubiquitin-like protease family profile domain-containing protein n=1 Tax=Pisolithus tinctorius Marx 270 TaxID=870435 RepID=A0A0C3NVK3_PISTI|nr:hypothetical protein M404DRAFT_30479 [Pisolithus tinctorius Marx 270]